jgi:hypothetical protein
MIFCVSNTACLFSDFQNLLHLFLVYVHDVLDFADILGLARVRRKATCI